MIKGYKEFRDIGYAFKKKYNLGSNFKVEVFNTYIHVIRKRYVIMLGGFTNAKYSMSKIKSKVNITETTYLPFKEGIRSVIVEDE